MLQQLKREYGRHEAAASTGRQVFSRLRQRELTDRILVALGMLVFALVVLYILKSRLLPSLSLTGWLWSTSA